MAGLPEGLRGLAGFSLISSHCQNASSPSSHQSNACSSAGSGTTGLPPPPEEPADEADDRSCDPVSATVNSVSLMNCGAALVTCATSLVVVRAADLVALAAATAVEVVCVAEPSGTAMVKIVPVRDRIGKMLRFSKRNEMMWPSVSTWAMPGTALRSMSWYLPVFES